MQKQSRAQVPPHSGAEIVWGMDPHSLDVVNRTYRAWFSQANRMRDEAVRFAQDRFEQELEAAVQLARCTNPTDAFTLQAKFASKMAADYLAEGQKMVEWMGEMAKQVSNSTGNPHHH